MTNEPTKNGAEGLKTLWFKELTREQQRKVVAYFCDRVLHFDFRNHGYLTDAEGNMRYWDWVLGDDFGKLKRI